MAPNSGRRVIYLKNPRGGSHFITINGGGSKGGGPGRHKTSQKPLGGKTLFEIIHFGPQYVQGFVPKKKGKGIEYENYVIELTGGARYHTPDNEWFVAPPQQPPPGFGTLPETGVVSPTDISIQIFQPSQTLLGSAWYILHGVDPGTGEVIPALGTPGTLKFGAGTEWMSFTNEQIDTGRLQGNPVLQGYSTGASGFGTSQGQANLNPTIPAGLKTRTNIYNLPEWLQRYENFQNMGITFDLTQPGPLANATGLRNAASYLMPPRTWKPFGY